ncbi:hypothetical protein OG895_21930 [Streptomyces sp. NBC_00201]|uniref:hypothetical protein n=1 Tax=Streptomyces sp. NBC_00201 TaxID=2975679 RepID=UPI00224CB460|nr:hypothetical protein [Streptomyces sp. NBC_00201]MCX5247838.1 hypothetical protein [Streptomyces sp. NBC_00201]
MVGSEHDKADDSSVPATGFMVVAYQRAVAVCEVVSVGAGLNGTDATYFAHELREEFPGAIVAILPKN